MKIDENTFEVWIIIFFEDMFFVAFWQIFFEKTMKKLKKKGQFLQAWVQISVSQRKNKGLTAPSGDWTQPMHDVDDIRVVRAATTKTVVATTMCCIGFACP